ncbi:lysine N(6)-hydroxylase/L-ornithine N(5)-oxygenase family protein [Nocardioides sp. Root140]|uniref:lysine N(6)-hydroxylase/L-ornithine N(5)-oxygenase family protein n=1 Tax=Nocardioides sp. Root140 TaxID=1736460 RepID=UPI0006FC4852|nr:SidA/IucD/PvdA family monooxygenase [Nocardioides sp. Root140]KQY57563.1 alcaligin biosynthesis protein [Nocardioides sp. Root140]
MKDFVAVGLGPFNLGLACLTDPIDELDGLFLEARSEFAWHPGMMLEDATLQVPFLADLVTMADPTSRFSFLNHLKEIGRLYPFYIRESFFPLRQEYSDYCAWAASRLDSVRFDSPVTRIEHDGSAYVVTTGSGEQHEARRLVLGTGTQPYVPEVARGVLGPEAGAERLPQPAGVTCHSADYLRRKAELQELESITVVGSGQSAAEVYADLLAGIDEHGYTLTWVTRSPRFFPMEYTKLTLELTSPEYTSYFQGLPGETREELLRGQRSLYKGISAELVNHIYDELYRRQVHGGTETTLVTNTAVTAASAVNGGVRLELHHVEEDEHFALETRGVVFATGYNREVPEFLSPIRDRIRWDDHGRFLADANYAIDVAGNEIYVQNAEEHTHGFVAPDLGMGAYRNSRLIAAMLGRETYPIEKRIAFQEFGVPDHLRSTP